MGYLEKGVNERPTYYKINGILFKMDIWEGIDKTFCKWMCF